MTFLFNTKQRKRWVMQLFVSYLKTWKLSKSCLILKMGPIRESLGNVNRLFLDSSLASFFDNLRLLRNLNNILGNNNKQGCRSSKKTKYAQELFQGIHRNMDGTLKICRLIISQGNRSANVDRSLNEFESTEGMVEFRQEIVKLIMMLFLTLLFIISARKNHYEPRRYCF